MGKASRDKGARGEREIVNAWQEAGFGAERIPLSGAAGGSFTGDVTIPIMGDDLLFEAKVRAVGFKQIYDWLGTNFGLFIKADRRDRLIVLREKDFIAIVRAAEGRK